MDNFRLKLPSNPIERQELAKMANLMWDMLDDMKESDSDGYRKFISRQLKEGAEHFSPPKPAFSFSTQLVSVFM